MLVFHHIEEIWLSSNCDSGSGKEFAW